MCVYSIRARAVGSRMLMFLTALQGGPRGSERTHLVLRPQHTARVRRSMSGGYASSVPENIALTPGHLLSQRPTALTAGQIQRNHNDEERREMDSFARRHRTSFQEDQTGAVTATPTSTPTPTVSSLNAARMHHPLLSYSLNACSISCLTAP